MKRFKIYPKKRNGRFAIPEFTTQQLDKIDSNYYAYHIVWDDVNEKYFLAQSYDLRKILWNHTDT